MSSGIVYFFRSAQPYSIYFNGDMGGGLDSSIAQSFFSAGKSQGLILIQKGHGEGILVGKDVFSPKSRGFEFEVI